jgi:hypothetical protein
MRLMSVGFLPYRKLDRRAIALLSDRNPIERKALCQNLIAHIVVQDFDPGLPSESPPAK